MTKLQRERNLKLADALESGNYKQGKGLLSVNNTHCCLGVACEIAIEGGLTLNRRMGDLGDLVTTFDSYSKLPPESVAEYFGWDSSNPIITIQSISCPASDFNDISGANFSDIADGFRRLARKGK